MDNDIMKQISDLNDLQNKAMNSYGDYKNINIAIAALQICSHYGLNETSKIISFLKQSPLKIDNEERLELLFKECSKILIPAELIYDKFIFRCSQCNNELSNINNYLSFKVCPYCGQAILHKTVKGENNHDDVIRKNE